MDVYFACPGKYARETGRRAALMSYEAFGRRVYRTEPPDGSGSMMIVNCEKPYYGSKETFVRDILGECRLRRFRSVFLDRESPPDGLLTECTALLSRLLRQNRMLLFLSPALWTEGAGIVVLPSSPLSGKLTVQLEKARAQYGAFAGDIRVLREKVTLPVTEGALQSLSPPELTALRKARNHASFYSEELCTRYFSLSENGESGFVLYDTAETLAEKSRLLQEYGASAVFYYYPEIRDFISAPPAGSPSPPWSGEALPHAHSRDSGA